MVPSSSLSLSSKHFFAITTILISILIACNAFIHPYPYSIIQSKTLSSLSFVPKKKKKKKNQIMTKLSKTTNNDNNTTNNNILLQTDTILTTKSSILDKNLTNDERSVVNVVRLRGPSVAYVTSYAIPTTNNNNNNQNNKNNKKSQSVPRQSTPLGSGSAFAISSDDGYFVTNYHVIEGAYKMQQNEELLDLFIYNITHPFTMSSSSLEEDEGKGKKDDGFLYQKWKENRNRRHAQVYIRLASSISSSSMSKNENLIPARIVSVKPELDTAILQITIPKDSNSSNTMVLPQPIPYGSSSKLLVGQSVLAIGNPFGLDQTLTSGVVSALNRSVRGVANNQISNCIQTDAAINPGNSGGPLLNSNGECVGMNTMIISTSGSNAGIGFAIGMDEIKEYVECEIELDRMDNNERLSSLSKKKRGWLGIEIATDVNFEKQLKSRIYKQLSETKQNMTKNQDDIEGVFVIQVEKDSPAYKASIQATTIDKSTSRINIGDRIIAINSNLISSYRDLCADLKMRVVGENLAITIEDNMGDRKVVYVELGERKDD